MLRKEEVKIGQKVIQTDNPEFGGWIIKSKIYNECADFPSGLYSVEKLRNSDSIAQSGKTLIRFYSLYKK